MARAGLTDVIGEIRTMMPQQDNDLSAATYWNNDEIQAVLDNNRVDMVREPVTKIQEYSSGTVIYKKHKTRPFLETGANFDLQTSAGSSVGTALYSVDWRRGMITFADDTGGSSYYVSAYSYDMHAAASEIWRKKAAYYATAIDFRTDNTSMSRSQLMQQALQMADHYDNKTALQVSTMQREDM
jgi:hypothetical protein